MTDVLDRAEAMPVVEPSVTTTPPTRREFELSTGARLLLAAFSLGAGAIHLAMVPSHWGSSTAEGLSFAVTGWLQIAFAVMVVAKPSRLLLQLGIAVNATLIGYRLFGGEGGLRAPLIAGAIVVVATLLYFVLRPKNITDEAMASLGD